MTPSTPHPRIALVGPNGAVGSEYLKLFAERCIRPEDLILISHRNTGSSRVDYRGSKLEVQGLDRDCFRNVDVAFFATDAQTSRKWCPVAVEAGASAVDNSSAFRGEKSVPLVVPGVNSRSLENTPGPGIISVPNCTTIITLMAIAPVHREAGIIAMNLATYQAVSGAGLAALSELEAQAKAHVEGKAKPVEALPSQAFFNVFSHESGIDQTGFNEEERKIREESRRILDAPQMRISATCMRVGIPRAHTVAISLDLSEELDAREAAVLLRSAPGVRVVDDRDRNRFPEPIAASGKDEVLVGRFRNDPDRGQRSLMLVATGDQLRKGAALSGIELMELLGSRAEGR